MLCFAFFFSLFYHWARFSVLLWWLDYLEVSRFWSLICLVYSAGKKRRSHLEHRSWSSSALGELRNAPECSHVVVESLDLMDKLVVLHPSFAKRILESKSLLINSSGTHTHMQRRCNPLRRGPMFLFWFLSCWAWASRTLLYTFALTFVKGSRAGR